MRNLLLTLFIATLSLPAPTLLGGDAPKAPALHFKKDLGVQDTVYGKLHLYEGLWPVRAVTPPYPRPALVARVTGTVVMDVLIAEDGSVADVRVRTSSGSADLDAAGLAGIKRWRYPASPDQQRCVNIETYAFTIDG